MIFPRIVLLGLIGLCSSLMAKTLRIELSENTKELVPSWMESCSEVAERKLGVKARSLGKETDLATLRVVGYSSNSLASYTWWRIDTQVEDESGVAESLQVLVQKPQNKDCF